MVICQLSFQNIKRNIFYETKYTGFHFDVEKLKLYISCSPLRTYDENGGSQLERLITLDRSISNRRGVWLVFINITVFYNIPAFDINSVKVLRRLIWVYTVFPFSFYGTPGMNGLIFSEQTYILESVESKLASFYIKHQTNLCMDCFVHQFCSFHSLHTHYENTPIKNM